MDLRIATSADAQMLADLSFTTFWDAFHEHPMNAPEDMEAYMSEAFSVGTITRELSDPSNVFVIAEIDGNDAGYAKLAFGSVEVGVKANTPVELCRLYSRTEFIGKGVGQHLMDACFAMAVEKGCDVMWLGVWEYNPRARRFYEKNGFRKVGCHVFQLGSDPQTDDLMQVELGPEALTTSLFSGK